MTSMPERVARAIATAMDQPLPRFVQQRWEDLTPQAREAMQIRAIVAFRAMRYEDGTDEDLAIIASRRVGVDAVIVIDCWDAMLAAILRT
jgi:hypothetical protein